MDQQNVLAERFEAERSRLQGVAFRMLGSLGEAEDAVQETWLRLSRTGDEIDNLGGWLTTVVARLCLDKLRARKARPEEPAGVRPPEPANDGGRPDPEQEAMLADSVGLALLVVLDRLGPAERIAFVLHDLFDISFEEIAPIVGRSTDAARQLASRARRRVRGEEPVADVTRERRRALVEAFLAASQQGDFEGLLTLLDPDVTFRGDAAAVNMGGPRELHGAEAVARRFKGRAQAARAALLDGELGLVVAPRGRLLLVLGISFSGDRIAGIEAIADPERLGRLRVTALD